MSRRIDSQSHTLISKKDPIFIFSHYQKLYDLYDELLFKLVLWNGVLPSWITFTYTTLQVTQTVAFPGSWHTRLLLTVTFTVYIQFYDEFIC